MFAQKHVSEGVQTGYIPVSAPFFIKKNYFRLWEAYHFRTKKKWKRAATPTKATPTQRGEKSSFFNVTEDKA